MERAAQVARAQQQDVLAARFAQAQSTPQRVGDNYLVEYSDTTDPELRYLLNWGPERRDLLNRQATESSCGNVSVGCGRGGPLAGFRKLMT